MQLSDTQILTIFTKQSSAEKLNAFLKKVSLKKTVDDHTDECLACLKREAILTALSVNHELDIALGNHALRAQPTDYSLICRYRLVNNLLVALFPKINCRLLANEKTDGDYNV